MQSYYNPYQDLAGPNIISYGFPNVCSQYNTASQIFAPLGLEPADFLDYWILFLLILKLFLIFFLIHITHWYNAFPMKQLNSEGAGRRIWWFLAFKFQFVQALCTWLWPQTYPCSWSLMSPVLMPVLATHPAHRPDSPDLTAASDQALRTHSNPSAHALDWWMSHLLNHWGFWTIGYLISRVLLYV